MTISLTYASLASRIFVTTNVLFLLISIPFKSYSQQPSLVIPFGITKGLDNILLSPDDQFVLLTQKQNKAILYEKQSGKQIYTLAHNETIEHVKFSPSGRFLISSAADQSVLMTVVETGEIWFSGTFASNHILHMEFDLAEQRVYFVTSDSAIRVFHISTRQVSNAVQLPAPVENFKIDPKGQYLLFGYKGRTHLYNKDLDSLFSFADYSQSSFMNSGADICYASGSQIRLVNIESKVERVHTTLPDSIISFKLSADNERLIALTKNNTFTVIPFTGNQTGGKFTLDGKVPLWYELNENGGTMAFRCQGEAFVTILDVLKSRVKFRIDGIPKTLNGACFDECGQHVLTGGEHDDAAYLYNLTNGEIKKTYVGSIPHINAMDLSINDDRIILASEDGTAKVIDTQTGNTIKYFFEKGVEVRSVNYSPDGKSILVSTDQSVHVYDAEDFSIRYSLAYSPQPSLEKMRLANGNNQAIFSLDGLYLVRKAGYQLFFHASADGKLLHTISINTNLDQPIEKFCINRNALLTVIYHGGYLKCFDTKKQNLIEEFYTDGLKDFAVSPDGTLLYFNDRQGAKLLVLKGSNESVKFENFGNTTEQFAFSQDNQLVSYIENKQLYITDRITKSILHKKNLEAASNGKEVHLEFTRNSRFLLVTDTHSVVYLFDCRTGNVVFEMSGLRDHVDHLLFSSDFSRLYTLDYDHKLSVWNTLEKNVMYQRIEMEDNNWLAWDEHFRFDGTPTARSQLYFTCGTEVIELEQMKEALYVPGLVGQINEGRYLNFTRLSDLNICGGLSKVKLVKQENQINTYSIEPGKFGLERVDIYIDKKRVRTCEPEKMLCSDGNYMLKLDRKQLTPYLIPGEKNSLRVVGISRMGAAELVSRGVVTTELPDLTEQREVNLYAMMIGVSNYRDDAMDLTYPVKDALALGSVLEPCAKKLLGDEAVHFYHINSSQVSENGRYTPEKENIRLVLQEIGQKAKAQDIVLLFFAGHGVMIGEGDKTFTFLTSEATKSSPQGISTTELEDWLSSTGPHQLLANKTILIFDACNSGEVVNDMISAISRNDDETRRIRQVEDLKDKSGVFIMAASASNQSAYELPKFKQGLLTYAMLKTLKNQPDILEDGAFVNLQKWFLESEEELDEIARQHGINQQAQPFGSANIRIGELTEEIRNTISIAEDKPLVYCMIAENENDEDPMQLQTETTKAMSDFEFLSEAKFSHSSPSQEAIGVKLSYKVTKSKTYLDMVLLKNGSKISSVSWFIESTNPKEMAAEIVRKLNEQIP